MRDEGYEPSQIAPYGSGAQPAIVARMRPHLRMTQAGNAAALVAVGLGAAAVARFPDFTGQGRGVAYAVTALVCAALMLGICTTQQIIWLRAMAVWSGRRSGPLERLTLVSWILHLASYAVVLVALWAGIAGSAEAGWTASAATLLAVSLACTIVAQVLAGVQYLRTSGPPGTVPAHMRRLLEREAAKVRRERSGRAHPR